MNFLNHKTGLAILTAMTLAGCTSIPKQLEGDFSSLKPKQATVQDVESRVRWAGVILETRPDDGHTCFEILSRQVDRSMQPKNVDQTEGRFVACKAGFYDPEIFEKDREVTLTGKIIHMDTRKVGEYDYHFPVVDIEFMTLWPVRREPAYYQYGPYRPYYWHYPYYGLYWRYPF